MYTSIVITVYFHKYAVMGSNKKLNVISKMESGKYTYIHEPPCITSWL